MSGGGTGGHVMPVLAVTAELERLDPDAEIVYVAQVHDPSQSFVREQAPHLRIREIQAGKLRRFHGVSKLRQLTDVATTSKNTKDLFRMVRGVQQAYRILGKERPDVVFIKGGYVGLPVGIAARMRRIPIVTHDSDAMPGLTNKILSRWAAVSAVTMPENCYPQYKSTAVRRTGLPVSKSFEQVAGASKQSIRRELGLPIGKSIVLVVPGSLGARVINDALIETMPAAMKKSDFILVHVTGKNNYQEVQRAYEKLAIDTKRVYVKPFVDNIAEFVRAADVVITRAGSMLIELAAVQAAVISVPNPLLTGGHQLKNASMYEKSRAIKIIPEQTLKDSPSTLLHETMKLLANTKERKRLGAALHVFYDPKSAEHIAQILLEVAAKVKGS